ncbi:MAG: tetratricopeptide repeat protein [Acidobacteriia bacterium]|nr:tetratricopeptide repeat protein [Terriglobia bacterium]
MFVLGRIWLAIPLAAVLLAASPELDRARDLYQKTEYKRSLDVLLHSRQNDAEALQLIGQNYFMLGEYKKSSDTLEKAAALDPENAVILHWLGRAYARRAETANPFSAPGWASKARQMFERSVALDPSNKDATGDLLDFYLDAPGFLGGGTQKAEALAKVIGKTDPAEGHYAQAMIEDRRKNYDKAEEHFRHAADLAPKQVGRFIDLAKYLAKRGRIQESEAAWEQAARLAPNDPRVMFERAGTYIREQRNLGQARELLEKYLRAPLTPDDPPRQEAESLLKKIGA